MSLLSVLSSSYRHRAGLLATLLLCITGLASGQSVPAAPSNVTVGVTRISTNLVESQSYLIQWRDNSINESYFVLEVRVGLVGPYTRLTGLLVPANGELQTVALSVAFAPGTQLQWRVLAVADPTTEPGQLLNGDEKFSAPSPARIVTIPSVPSFNAPTGLSAALTGDGFLNVAWVDNSNTEEAFEIQSKLSTAPDSAYTTLVVPFFEQSSFSLVGGLLPGQSHSLRVRALC
jgi:hypothetical protein